jgi:serine/threonine protein kinase
VLQDDSRPGIVMGTAGYMSPEQARGLPVDHRTDIFAFGAIVFEMLSGRRAFGGDTTADAMAAVVRESRIRDADSGFGIQDSGLFVRSGISDQASGIITSARSAAIISASYSGDRR